MREVTVRLRFTKHCLGQVRRHRWSKGKRSNFFVMPRNPDGKVVFMPSWWSTVLAKAAEVLCRHQRDVTDVRFSMVVDGKPRPIPEQFYRRYHTENTFSRHEAFFPGDIIGVSCLVPEAIDDEDLSRLLTLAGKYYGISPAKPNEYGFFEVVSVQRLGTVRKN